MGARSPSPTPGSPGQAYSAKKKIPHKLCCKNQWGLSQWNKLLKHQAIPLIECMQGFIEYVNLVSCIQLSIIVISIFAYNCCYLFSLLRSKGMETFLGGSSRRRCALFNFFTSRSSRRIPTLPFQPLFRLLPSFCLLYTSDAADERK